MPRDPERLPARALAECLLDLHRASQRMTVRELQTFVFERFAKVVCFDSGLLGSGVFERGVPQPYDVVLHGQPPTLMESWHAIRHLDRLTALTIATPWRTVNADLEELHGDFPAVVAHQREFHLAHALSTITIDERAGLCSAFSLYRRDPAKPFHEDERALTELFLPHVVDALRTARIAQLRAETRTVDSRSSSRAIVSSTGLVLEAEDGFIELVGGAFPDWKGPRLPTELVAPLADERPTPFFARRLAFRAVPSEDLRLVHVRRATQVDTLTERELEVARQFATGASTAEVAATLGIAVNTVRSHLGRVYEKLGVENKAELATMLAGYD